MSVEAIRHMQDTEGWQMVERFITERINENKDRLMTCPIEDVPKHRARAEALQSVFIFIQEILQAENDS